MYNLSIETMLSAAHLMRNYEGACSRLHGHNWKIKVEVSADKLNEAGMTIDFKDLEDISNQVISKFDHQYFNEIAPFDKINPTAENLARYFYREIAKLLPENIKMSKISLWETKNYLVEYSE